MSARRQAEAPEVRFWRHVNKTSGCWLWTGYKNRKGYGSFGFAPGITQQAHRVSYYFANGEIPAGMLVLHRCDRPGCVNPVHLFLGTHEDNMRDMVAKGRGRAPRADACKNAKIDWPTVQEIRILHAQGVKHQALAKRFGVGSSTITRIARGKTWKAGDYLPPPRELNSHATLNWDAVAEARRLGAQGVRQIDIAARIGTSQSNVSRILRGELWKEKRTPC